MMASHQPARSTWWQRFTLLAAAITTFRIDAGISAYLKIFIGIFFG